jgi:hypothetical protein
MIFGGAPLIRAIIALHEALTLYLRLPGLLASRIARGFVEPRHSAIGAKRCPSPYESHYQQNSLIYPTFFNQAALQ